MAMTSNADRVGRASDVTVGMVIQHPAKRWTPRAVLSIQRRGDWVHFVIAGMTAGTSTSVRFPAGAKVLIVA